MEIEARLRAFAAFARRRSFSAAAQELHISQPAVSKHIADVEREIGVKLVLRSASRSAVEAAWADAGITPRRHLHLPSWEAVKLAVARGDGIAGCSRFAVEAECRAGSLSLLKLRGWKVRRTISIIRVRDAALTPAAREFLTMLRAQWGRPTRQRHTHRAPHAEIDRRSGDA